jgi:hypothetical protein
LRVAATGRVREPLATLARAIRGLALAASTTAFLAADVIGSTARGLVAPWTLVAPWIAVPGMPVDGMPADGCSAFVSSALTSVGPARVASCSVEAGSAAPSSLVGPAANGSLVVRSLLDGFGRGSTTAGVGSSACAADCVRLAYASRSQPRATVLSRGAITANNPRIPAAAKSVSDHGRRLATERSAATSAEISTALSASALRSALTRGKLCGAAEELACHRQGGAAALGACGSEVRVSPSVGAAEAWIGRRPASAAGNADTLSKAGRDASKSDGAGGTWLGPSPASSSSSGLLRGTPIRVLKRGRCAGGASGSLAPSIGVALSASTARGTSLGGASTVTLSGADAGRPPTSAAARQRSWMEPNWAAARSASSIAAIEDGLSPDTRDTASLAIQGPTQFRPLQQASLPVVGCVTAGVSPAGGVERDFATNRTTAQTNTVALARAIHGRARTYHPGNCSSG